VLLKLDDGEAEPLSMRLSENSWLATASSGSDAFGSTTIKSLELELSGLELLLETPRSSSSEEFPQSG